MATIAPTIVQNDQHIDVTWANLTESDTASAVQFKRPPAGVSVYVSGTFGSATVVFQGSLDASNYWTMLKTDGNDISFTAAGGAQGFSMVHWVKPSASGGTGQDVTITATFLMGPERSA